MVTNRPRVLLERLVNLFRSEERRVAGEHGLLPVHLDVLQYVSRANRYSDTPGALAEYLGLTKGTTSQTLIILERQGLIARVADTQDRRRIHIKLTIVGKRTVAQLSPPGVFKEAQKHLPDCSAAHLEILLRQVQRIGGFKTFGECRSCRFLKTDRHRFRCGLTGENLTPKETLQICREHENP